MSENILICLIYKTINKCTIIEQMCVRSAILAVLIQIMHEGRSVSNTNAYEGMRNRPKQK